MSNLRAVTYEEAPHIQELVQKAQRVLIMQADNPDGDSLASALALEQIIGDMGKEPYLYCGMRMPEYLRHLPGWDRVSDEVPATFDLSIIVDTSADSLFGILRASGTRQVVASRPCIIIDHHQVEPDIPYASVICNPVAVATGQVIYELAGQLGWELNLVACEMLTSSILADSLGLTTEATSARSIFIVGELVAKGVSIAKLDHRRRALMQKPADIVRYKGELLQRIEYLADGQVAAVTIPWEEIERYSQAYNPSMLVIDDMRLTVGVKVAVAYKLYADGKITAKIRCNYGSPIAGDLALRFGGGGHPYASGFKLTDGRTLADVKAACTAAAAELLAALPAGDSQR